MMQCWQQNCSNCPAIQQVMVCVCNDFLRNNNQPVASASKQGNGNSIMALSSGNVADLAA